MQSAKLAVGSAASPQWWRKDRAAGNSLAPINTVRLPSALTLVCFPAGSGPRTTWQRKPPGPAGRGERDVVEPSAKAGCPSRYYSLLGRKVPERGEAGMEYQAGLVSGP